MGAAIAMGVSAAVGYDFGKEVSKKTPSELLKNFKQLSFIKKSLIVLFTIAILGGLYLNINPPQINNKAITQATELAEQISINFGTGFVATIVINKIYSNLPKNTNLESIELSNLDDD